jgi:hypothetical protein
MFCRVFSSTNMPDDEGEISPPPHLPTPQGIPPKPDPEKFERPVAWLLGRQLIASLKFILLFTAFKGKLDARDWMEAEVFPADDSDHFWSRQDANTEEEFWFDYIADSGDGQRAMYSVASLCLSDLAISTETQVGETVEFVDGTDPAKQGKTLLPRGAFLFIGGDTSYHIADYATLANRVQNPFWWAFNDLKGSVDGQRHLLFGIPGNHDYYDSLDGFNRQFRRPSSGDKIVAGERPPLLMLPTFERRQSASYVALHLPFDWWFWGLDTEAGEIDFRQLEFFRKLQEDHQPAKLIVATPEPAIVFGKPAEEEENQSKTFKAIGLERPFLRKPEPLPKNKCRLDLSGDVHHYARYFGPSPGSDTPHNYASVMAGGGGAFFHPTQTNVHEVEQKTLYPSADRSRQETANELFKIKNILSGGLVWLFGFVVAFAFFFTAHIPPSSKEAIDRFPPFVSLGISQPAQPGTITPISFLSSPWTIALVLALGSLIAALSYSIKLFKKEYDPTAMTPRKKVRLGQRATVWLLVAIAFASLAFGIWGFQTYEPSLSRYSHSFIIFISLLWALLAVIQSVLYSGWLFEESYAQNIRTWHYWPIWVLLVMSVVAVSASFWFFGTHQAAYLIADLVQLSILVSMGGGLTYLAVSVGGALQRGIGKVGFLLLGVSHAVLQLAVPFLLIRKGHLLLAPLAALVVVVLFQFIGRALAKRRNGWPLAIGWVVFGALLLSIPSIFHAAPLNLPVERWKIFLLCFYAGGVGALMSCVLFGWYLAVSLAFNGHNNEAGGAARSEKFRHLVRFRLNRNGLTGYVIAIDDVGTERKDLHPRLIDVFRISNQ